MPFQFHGQQVTYDAIQRTMAAIQIVLDAHDHFRRALSGEHHFDQDFEDRLGVASFRIEFSRRYRSGL